MQAPELIVPPLIQVAVVAIAMWCTAIALPVAEFSIPGVVSVSVIVLGSLIAILGVLEFRKSKTTVDPRAPHKAERLVVDGIYRFSRNPMYLGFLLWLLGWGLYLGNGLSLIFLPIFVAYMNRFQIHPEERHLEQKFGAEFANYAARVRRWV
jgi:protein-S-isoprenylcysteine O-methyltransferase Ste14